MMFVVEAKFGHVGRNQYIIKEIPVSASSKTEAASIVRNMPRVKHHHPDAIRQVRTVDAPRYWECVAVHNADPYFKCRSIQEQRALCPDMELHPECQSSSYDSKKKEISRKNVFNGKERIRNPKRYINYHCDSEGFAA